MSGEWRTVPLGEVLALDETPPVPTPRDEVIRLAGIRLKGGGLYEASATPGASVKAKQLWRLRPGAFVYNRMWATRGTFAVVPESAAGMFATNEYPQFRLSDELSAAYLALVVQQPAFLDQVDAAAVGSTDRRRLHPDAFLELEIELPSLPEQARIVEAVRRIDAARDAHERHAAAAAAVLRALREELFADLEPTPLDDLVADIEGGRSPRALDRPPAPGEPGVLKVSAIRPGAFRASEAKRLPPDVAMPERARVAVGDLLVNRASGSLKLLCSACVVDAVPERLFLSDKTLRLVPAAGVDARCLAEALAVAEVREQIEREGEGTSGAKNVGQADIRAFELPWPETLAQQRAIAAQLAAARASWAASQREATALARLRAALVEELTTGARTLPDAFPEAA